MHVKHVNQKFVEKTILIDNQDWQSSPNLLVYAHPVGN